MGSRVEIPPNSWPGPHDDCTTDYPHTHPRCAPDAARPMESVEDVLHRHGCPHSSDHPPTDQFAQCRVLARALAEAGIGALAQARAEGAYEAGAEAHNLAHEVDRVRGRLWRLAALAGWRPGNPADNDATAELYITEALNAARAAAQQAATPQDPTHG